MEWNRHLLRCCGERYLLWRVPLSWVPPRFGLSVRRVFCAPGLRRCAVMLSGCDVLPMVEGDRGAGRPRERDRIAQHLVVVEDPEAGVGPGDLQCEGLE